MQEVIIRKNGKHTRANKRIQAKAHAARAAGKTSFRAGFLNTRKFNIVPTAKPTAKVSPSKPVSSGGQTAQRARPSERPSRADGVVNRPDNVGTQIPSHMKVSKPSKGGRVRYKSGGGTATHAPANRGSVDKEALAVTALATAAGGTMATAGVITPSRAKTAEKITASKAKKVAKVEAKKVKAAKPASGKGLMPSVMKAVGAEVGKSRATPAKAVQPVKTTGKVNGIRVQNAAQRAANAGKKSLSKAKSKPSPYRGVGAMSGGGFFRRKVYTPLTENPNVGSTILR